ncbi:MAG TPA: hypothetical protein VFQ84_08190 [Arenimonas sp.]|uniref:hypothetical protein n=1 Tax=Arenimonas sp. TaxID=1872635 RepID=UPI002D80ECCD|nr:hypothetical protein [Arenimonas sp.]HEU0153308.1 hypothetical protein [Arenimonas sp.]
MSNENVASDEGAFFADLEALLEEMDSEPMSPATKARSSSQVSGKAVEAVCRSLGMEEPPTPRCTRDAWSARMRLSNSRNVLRWCAQQVVQLEWDAGAAPGPILRKKAPFSLVIKGYSEPTRNDSKKGEEDFFPQTIPVQRLDALGPVWLPSWKNVAREEREIPGLGELIAGLQIASVIHGEKASLESWWSGLPGDDACALSIDLRGRQALRFYSGEGDGPRSMFRRSFRRRLERVLGETSMAAAWADIGSEKVPGVRLFLFLRSQSTGNAVDREVCDRSDRYFKSLIKHGVPLPPDDMPIWINDLDDKARYFGISREELEDRVTMMPGEASRIGWVEEQEFTPEDGFASAAEIEARARRSHDRWRRITADHRLPVWFGERFTWCLARHFGVSKDAKRFCRRLPMRIYRGSPACLAAVVMRSEPVFGRYVESRHRTAAASLYGELRALDRGH